MSIKDARELELKLINHYQPDGNVRFTSIESKSFDEDINYILNTFEYSEDLALALAVEYRHRMITNSVNMGEHYTNKHTEGYCPNKSIDLKSSYDVDKLLTDPRMNANNKSGIPNISCLVRNGKTTIVASKTIKGKIKTKKMSVDRYGFEFSINELKMWLKEISL